MEHAIADITRILLDAQSAIATQQISQEINTESSGALETEDDILAAAISLSEHTPTLIYQAAPSKFSIGFSVTPTQRTDIS